MNEPIIRFEQQIKVILVDFGVEHFIEYFDINNDEVKDNLYKLYKEEKDNLINLSEI